MYIWQYKSVIHQKSTTLTNEQIKALPSTPIEVVPSQGQNRIILPVFASVLANFLVSYTADAGSSWTLQWTGGGACGSPYRAQPTLGTSGRTIVILSASPFFSADVVGDFAFVALAETGGDVIFVENKGVQITDSWVGVPDYTGGDEENEMTVSVGFFVYDINSKEFVV